VTRPLIALMLLLLAPALAAAQQPRPEPVVVTTGEGLIQAVPDRAWVNITAESRASNPREAQQRNADAMAPVQAKLRSAGIPGDAIKTIAYDLQQEWDFVNNRRVSRGYVARNTIEVRVDAIDRVGEMLEIAVGTGATSVGGIRFDLKDRAKLERDALRLAVADARAKAEAEARARADAEARAKKEAEELRARLEAERRVIFRYVTRDGDPTAEANPNGSLNNIAGITNERGNVLGMMPHPERAGEARLGSTDGLLIFRSMIESAVEAVA